MKNSEPWHGTELDARECYDLDDFTGTLFPLHRPLSNLSFTVDVDVRAPTLGKKRDAQDKWFYWGSHKTQAQAHREVVKDKRTLIANLGKDCQVRLVEASSGKRLELLTNLEELSE